MQLADHARIRFAHVPTPIEPLERLTEHCAGPRLFVKRDDCTGLAGGGNKTRKLEFLMAEAVAQGADTIITHGAVQSNHVRQTAAAAARLGLDCFALLEERVATQDVDYRESGNVLLDRLFGAQLDLRPVGSDMNDECERLAETLRGEGRSVCVIPGGGSNPTGALGYVACALEIVEQLRETGLRIDCIIHGTGSAGTQAGLVAGLAAVGSDIPVLGVSVRHPRARQEEVVYDLAQRTARHLGAATAVRRAAVQVNDEHVGPGYGLLAEGTRAALRVVAEREAILLDPVYTAKAMAGLLAAVEAGAFRAGQNVLFIHTGGATSLFGYRAALSNAGGESADFGQPADALPA